MIEFRKDGTAILIGAFDEKESLLGFIWAYKRAFQQEIRLHINYF